MPKQRLNPNERIQQEGKMMSERQIGIYGLLMFAAAITVVVMISWWAGGVINEAHQMLCDEGTLIEEHCEVSDSGQLSENDK